MRSPGGGPQAHAAHKDAGGCLVDTLERAVMLHLEAVHPGWPVPAALRSGFEDGKARQPHAALRGTIAPPMRRACNASGPGVHRGPRFLRCRCGQRRRLLRDTGALAGGERGLPAAPPRCRLLLVVVFSHDGAPPRCRGMLSVGWRATCADRVVRGSRPGELRAGCAAGPALPGCTGCGARAGWR